MVGGGGWGGCLVEDGFQAGQGLGDFGFQVVDGFELGVDTVFFRERFEGGEFVQRGKFLGYVGVRYRIAV